MFCEASLEFGFPVPLSSVSAPALTRVSLRGLKCPLFTLRHFIESFVFPTGDLITMFQKRVPLKTLLLKAACFVFFVIVAKWWLYGFLDELGYHPEKTQAKTFTLRLTESL